MRTADKPLLVWLVAQARPVRARVSALQRCVSQGGSTCVTRGVTLSYLPCIPKTGALRPPGQAALSGELLTALEARQTLFLGKGKSNIEEFARSAILAENIDDNFYIYDLAMVRLLGCFVLEERAWGAPQLENVPCCTGAWCAEVFANHTGFDSVLEPSQTCCAPCRLTSLSACALWCRRSSACTVPGGRPCPACTPFMLSSELCSNLMGPVRSSLLFCLGSDSRKTSVCSPQVACPWQHCAQHLSVPSQ